MENNDYKQKYEKALERAKDYIDGHHIDVNPQKAMEYVFPELKESEDEKIRKEIKKDAEAWYKEHYEGSNPQGRSIVIGAYIDGALAWLEKQGKLIEEYEDKLDRCACESFDKGYKAALEKQGEQKSADKVEPKFKVGDIIRHKKKGFTCKIIAVDTEYRLSECSGTHLPFDFQDSYELVEQNPAWSEEDEYQINTILHRLDLKREYHKKKGNKAQEERYTVEYNWLKSLKERMKGE